MMGIVVAPIALTHRVVSWFRPHWIPRRTDDVKNAAA